MLKMKLLIAIYLNQNIFISEKIVKEVETRKMDINYAIDRVKKDLNSSYKEKIKEIKIILEILNNKKKEMEKGIEDFPKVFNIISLIS